MITETSSEYRLRPAERANFLFAAISVGVILGVLLGWLLPKTVWRTGGTTPLGDFALVCLVGAIVWTVLMKRPTRGRKLALSLAVLGVLVLREAAWRYWPLVLAMLYGVAVTSLILTLLGSFVYEARRASGTVAGFSVARLLTPERGISLILGLILLVWLMAATVFCWLIS